MSRKLSSEDDGTNIYEQNSSDEDGNMFAIEDFVEAVLENDHGEMRYLLKLTNEPENMANACDEESFSVLILASASGHLKTVKLLLENHANPCYRARDGSTALLCAVQDGHLKVASHLLQDPRVNVNETSRKRNAVLNPLCMAAGNSEGAAMVQMLLRHKADINITCGVENNFPLLYAVKANNLLTLRLLLKHKADINKQNRQMVTPLLYAMRDDKVDPEILSLLLSRKANPNLYGADGMNACLLAAYFGENDTLKMLVDAKADLTLKCRKTGRSAAEIFKDEFDEPFPIDLLTTATSAAPTGKTSPRVRRNSQSAGPGTSDSNVHIQVVQELLRTSQRVSLRIPRTVMGNSNAEKEQYGPVPMCCISVTLSLGKKLANQKITWQVDRPYLSFRALYKTLKSRFGMRELQSMQVQLPSLPRFVMWNLKHSMKSRPDQLMPHELLVSLTDFLCAVMRMPQRLQEVVEFLTPSPATAMQLHEFMKTVQTVMPEMEIVERTAETLGNIVSRGDKAFADFEDACISLRGAVWKLDFVKMTMHSKLVKPPLCDYSRSCRELVALLSRKPEQAAAASADIVYVGAQHEGQVIQSRDKLISFGDMFISEVDSLLMKTKKQAKLLHYTKRDLLELFQHGLANYEQLKLHINSAVENLKCSVAAWQQRNCTKTLPSPTLESESKPPAPPKAIILT